jgi:starch-binding outer membrane protein, SusD/RagB family
MKNRSRLIPYIIAIASAILIFNSGCKEEFYDVTAGDRINPDQHYRTLVDANVSLEGAIIPLQDAMPKLIMLDGLRSDMMEITPNADSYLRDLNNHILSPSNPIANPSDLYKVIVNINEVLTHIDRIAETDRDYDALTAYTYKGALIGMRAWTYLTLVRLYNKAVYIEDNLTSVPENLSQKVLSREVMLDTLINQLERYFKSEYTTTKYTEIRIPHYVNNKALLGELYLEDGQYSNAATYLKLACESYGNQAAMLKVDRTYQNAAWSTIFLNAESNSIENISAIPFSRAESQFNPIANWVGKNYQYMVTPSKVLVDSFMTQIPALGVPGDLWRGKGYTFEADTISKINDSTFITETYITKYAIDREDPFSSDIIISRAADIHLMLAEAYNRMGDPVSQKYALILINQGFNKENPKPAPFSRWSNNLGIRGRAYLKSREIPANMMNADSITTLIEDYIIAERALELAFEGKRWFDLVRVAERRNDPAFLADKVAAKFEGTGQYDAIRNKLMNPANWYLPFE